MEEAPMLKGKTALVTGSTSGIGLGIAKAFAAQGVNLVINGFAKPEEVEREVAGLKQLGIEVMFSGADMSKPAEIRQMAADAVKKFGAVDILVNNAGIQHVESIDTFPDDKWDAIIAINLSSAFHTTKALAPAMKQKKWGRIINVSSVHGLVASAYKSAYVAAKHGIMGLTKVTALDLAEFGITCNAICPGYVNTPLVQKQIPEQAKAHGISEKEVIEKVFLKNHAVKEFVEVEAIAALALYLCSDDARTLTGTGIPVDAGWTAQ
jgi:3-hydroxybutyrate dehydrogenase